MTARTDGPRERPMLFSASMVRALLAGTKTQTRRVMKPLPAVGLPGGDGWTSYAYGHGGWGGLSRTENGGVTTYPVPRCPHGVPGDRLWVKETWHPSARIGADEVEIEYRADESSRVLHPPSDFMWERWDDKWIHGGWRPSLFMSRWMSRITLEVTEVRAQRVQDISEEDARAEGAKFHGGGGVGHSGWRHDEAHGYVYANARESFCRLWDQINGAKSPWSSNPWVWAITVKPLEARR
jgi:hypothetical protein